MKAGLVSITFRKLTPAEIIKLAAEAKLDGIEWGGDVHVPHGDLITARKVFGLTRDAGLAVAAYGSYYHAAPNVRGENADLSFANVLETAKELDASTVRVWAGKSGSAQADEAYRAHVVEDLRRIGETAQNAGIGVSCEYHGGTLTDTNESAQALMQEVAHPNVRLYWQPSIGKPFEYCRDGLEAILPHLTNIHVFEWAVREGKLDQRPLAEGEAVWLEYLRLAETTGRKHWTLLEFVRDGSPGQFLEDAKTLKQMLLDIIHRP